MTARPSRPLPLAAAACLLTLAAGLTGRLVPELHAQALLPGQRLAAHLGVPEARLADLVSQDEVLLDGSRLSTVKAVDRADGRVVGASFLDGRVVDRRQAIDAAGRTWRAVNGALTPPLLEHLAAMAPQASVEVDVWFRIDWPAALDDKGADAGALTAGPPAGLVAELAQLRASEAAAIAWAAGRSADKAVADAPLPAAAAAALDTDPAGAGVALPAHEKPGVADAPVTIEPERLAASSAALAEDERLDGERLQRLRSELARQRLPLVARLQAAGIAVRYASDVVPSLIVALDRSQAAALSRWPEIDAMYLRPTLYGEDLGTARPTQNALSVNDVGYNGTGVIVSVSEGGRVFGENPFLTVDSYCNAGAAGADHATAVAGFIASTHATHRGLANGVTLRNANCASTEAIIDWGASNARVLNHSFWAENDPGTAAFNALDRRLDYVSRSLFDTPVKSAGNVGNGCTAQGGFTSDFVTSPGKGYNTVTVGNFDDLNSLTWTGDVMANCSSFGNPTGDGHSGGHEKPELAAVGSGMTSTTVSTVAASAVGGVGGGTSYSAPMVAATAANMIQALPALSDRPEAIKPILMAGALHNIEGAARLSDRDGAGGLVASANLAIVERGHLDYRFLAGAVDLPFSHYVLAKQGERVRFAIHWQSNPNLAYTSDPLPADVDLQAFRGDGTVVATSNSVNNPFEIVEFTAPVTDLYRFDVTLFGSWSGGGTYYGAGWWRGVDRFENGSWFTRGAAPPPLGDHVELRPTEALPSAYWHGVAVRPETADYDLMLYNGSWFGNPDGRALLNSSAFSGSALDFILVDGNHWPASSAEHYRVVDWSGSGSYQLSAGKHGTLLSSTSSGLFGPYTLNAIQSLFIADIGFDAASMRRIKLVPAAGSNDDFGLALYRSTAGDAGTYTRARSQAAASADASAAGGGEKLRYSYTGTGFDWLGLVVYNKTWNSAASFYLQVTPAALFSDGFDGD
jgi:hypothetical protein